MEGVINRIQNSWLQSRQEIAARELAGTQPDFPFSDVHHLIYANTIYFAVCFSLYEYMKKKQKGFTQLKPVIAVYNLICVCLAGYVVVGIVSHWYNHGIHSFVGNKEQHTTKYSHELGFVFWVFYIQKYWEFLDTFFFLLRRSFRQVSILHLFHHSSIPVVIALILPAAFSGDMYLPILLNSVVHVLMYSHYFVSCLGFKTPWKKYLTVMQLTQFVLIMAQSSIAWYNGPNYGVPDYGKCLLIGYMISMLVLFGNFFVQSYLTKSSKSKAQ